VAIVGSETFGFVVSDTTGPLGTELIDELLVLVLPLKASADLERSFEQFWKKPNMSKVAPILINAFRESRATRIPLKHTDQNELRFTHAIKLQRRCR
jgi:hypothetical protein